MFNQLNFQSKEIVESKLNWEVQMNFVNKNKIIFYIVLLAFFRLAASEKDDGYDISHIIKAKVCSNGTLEDYKIIGGQGSTLWHYSYQDYDSQVTDKKVLTVTKIVEIGGTANVIVMSGCEQVPVETARVTFHNQTAFKSRIEHFLTVYNMCEEANGPEEPFYIHLVEDKLPEKCTKAISLQFTKKQVVELLRDKSSYMPTLLSGVGIAAALLICYFNLYS